MRFLLPYIVLYVSLESITCRTHRINYGLKRTNPRPCTPRKSTNYERTQWSPYGTRRTPKWTKIFQTYHFEKTYFSSGEQRRRAAFLLARGIITTLGKGEIATEISTVGPLAHFPVTTLHPALFVFYNMLRYDNVKRAYMTPYAELVLDLMGKRHKLSKIIRNGQNTRWLVERGWTSTLSTPNQSCVTHGKEVNNIKNMMKQMKENYDKKNKINKRNKIFKDK